MKIAIIGAGVSGLSCAFRLNYYGIKPVIFEKKSLIGESRCSVCIHFNTFNNISKDPLKSLNNDFGLTIKPLFNINEFKMKVEKRTVSIKGYTGFTVKRGYGSDSIEQQLFSKINADIFKDCIINHEVLNDMKKEFDFVIVATGNNDLTYKENIWHETFYAKTRIAIISGDFNENLATMYHNSQYSKKGFVYLLPLSNNRAKLTLIVNDITTNEIDYYWKKFILSEFLDNEIIEIRDSDHITGILKTNQKDNVLFIGNAGGFVDSFAGFGLINSIYSGILAANAINSGQDFNKLIKPITNSIRNLDKLKMFMSTFDNKGWKFFISLMGLPIVKEIIYKYPKIHFHDIGKAVGKLAEKRIYK